MGTMLALLLGGVVVVTVAAVLPLFVLVWRELAWRESKARKKDGA